MMPVGDQACPFCEIIAGRGRATILREWTDVTAIAPLNPAVEGRALMIPHEHLERPDLGWGTAAAVLCCTLEYAHAQGDDYNLIVNVGEGAGQTVPHLHLHYLPRHSGDQVPMPWPHPGDRPEHHD
jgi:histidine triad (HIT) family protein